MHESAKEVKKRIYKFEGIPYVVDRRRVKYARVEFNAEGLKVIVPRGVKPETVLEDNRASILKKYEKFMGQMEASRQTPLTERSTATFQRLVEEYIKEYSWVLQVEISALKYRKMRRRWGSCRSDGLITLNSWLQFVPDRLLAYIIFHELAHMIVRGHNRDFKRIVAQEFPDYKILDKELTLYGLKLLS
ncbi:MAG: M48 family metallopeptidase [bacterium]|nr:M48 family metallopeptidase [bacterium]